MSGIGLLFGVEIDGERKDLFGSLDSAKQLQATVIAEGGTAVIFEAEIEARTREVASRELMRLGVQYYAAARWSAWAALLPVSGNLYHHALEVLLKAGLSRKYYSNDLRDKFRHNLPKLWNEFKAEYQAARLDRFDATIDEVADFAEVRYPDRVIKHGAQMMAGFRGMTGPVQIGGSQLRPEPEYNFYFDEIDRLIGKIFTVCRKNPLFFTSGLKPDVQDMLAQDNPVATQLLMHRG